MSANTLLVNGLIPRSKLAPSAIPKSIPPVGDSGSGAIQTPPSPNQTTPALAMFYNPIGNPLPANGLYLITLTLTSPYGGPPDTEPTTDWFDLNGVLQWYLRDDDSNIYWQGSATASTIPNASAISGAVAGEDYNSVYTYQSIVWLNTTTDYSFEVYAFAGATPNGTWYVPYTFDLSYLG
jgi:hypothetical protein